jgi:hypothetical protein
MELTNVQGLRAELALLEAQEAQLSAKRRHLHNQLDFGYASETTRAREGEISDGRRQLHSRIEELRETLATHESR